MILVLGAGWTGVRFCLRNPSRCVITTRSKEKLSELSAVGVNAVHFDLLKEETWGNLPPKSEVEATVITFALSATQQSQMERLWEACIATAKPVFCLGTSSCFHVGNHATVVKESAPLTGKGVTGAPLTDRVKGEDWALSKGATILHLSGITGEEENDTEKSKWYGISWSIKTSLSMRKFQNGFKLINFIHINDICKIILVLIEKHRENGSDGISGERILTSCGAFRLRDLVKALNMDPLPEIPPPDSTMNGSKIVAITKLLSLLPADYEWTLPVEGVEPVSRGLPLDATRDRQWELCRDNVEGKWQGCSVWYKKDKGEDKGGKLDHKSFIAEMNGATLPAPAITIENTQYHIYFLDADTAVWDGTGLAFGDKCFQFSKNTYNESGISFQFKGMAGQASTDTHGKTFAGEFSFFYQRSRSMITVLYTLDSTSNAFLLDSICTVPFRCGLGCDFPLKPLQSEHRRSVDSLLQSLSGKSCRQQWRSPTRALDETDGGELCQYPTKAVTYFSDPNRIVQSFDDDLICSIPTEVQIGGCCELVVGCVHTDHFTQMFTITYGVNGKIERQTLEKWQ